MKVCIFVARVFFEKDIDVLLPCLTLRGPRDVPGARPVGRYSERPFPKLPVSWKRRRRQRVRP